MSREAMQLALHTLEGWANYGKWVWPESALEQAKRNTTESIAALRQALETEQEPVISTDHGPWIPSTHPGEEGETYCKRCLLRDKFFGSRQCDPHIVYTAPQKREWVGLTDEEISAVDWKPNETLHDYARHIELKLRGKNT